MSRPDLPAVAFVLAIALGTASASAQAEKLTIERLFAAPDLAGATLRSAKFSPDGKRVAYLKAKDTAKDTFDLWSYDIAARRHALLVDSARLVAAPAALSAEEEARRERQRTSAFSGIVEYEFSKDSRLLLVPLGGDLYVYNLRARDAATAVRRLTNTEAYETDARFSPRGRYVSFVRDANLVVLELATGREQPITRDGAGTISYGMAEFIAQEEMDRDTGYWWGPDESRIAYTRVDESPIPETERFEILADSVQVIRQRYPFTGGPNALVSLFTAALAGGTPVAMDLGANTDIYLARVHWFPDSRALAVQRQSRDQKTLTLLRVEAETGAARELLTERSDTWIDLTNDFEFVSDSGEFIWGSSRTGYAHLYLYRADGTLRHPVTSGEWVVTAGGRGLDKKKGEVYFVANKESPIERQLYVASYRSPAPPRRVTTTPGWHAVQMSDDARYFLDTFSSTTQPPAVTLRGSSGREITPLVANTLDVSHPYWPFQSEHRPAVFGTLKASDGQTLHYKLVAPREIGSTKRHPVIVDVYGGPGSQDVGNSWGDLFHQYLAQQGYVVFALDNRGTAFRGTRFETALHRQMGSVEIADQIAGVEFLRTLQYVDPARIGVWGWSYGGYMALNCMTRAPDYFAAGVAGAPVTDWALYDTHYTERYMGTPANNAAGYAQSRVMAHARGLRGPLLMIHGMADDNVLFTHSTAMFKTLQDESKAFAVMPYPGGKHGLIRRAVTAVHAHEAVARFFDMHLKGANSP